MTGGSFQFYAEGSPPCTHFEKATGQQHNLQSTPMLSAFAFKDGSIYTIAAIPRIGSDECQEERNKPGIYVSKREHRRAWRGWGVWCVFMPQKLTTARKRVNSYEWLIWGGERRQTSSSFWRLQVSAKLSSLLQSKAISNQNRANGKNVAPVPWGGDGRTEGGSKSALSSRLAETRRDFRPVWFPSPPPPVPF